MNVRCVTVAAVSMVAVFALSHAAQGAPQAQAPARPQAPAAVAAPPAAPARPVSAIPPEAAEQTRKTLRKVLGYYSPNLGRVLALDPLLLQNASYLEPYPELAAFLNQHPEVTRNAGYYLSDFRPDYYSPPDRETRVIQVWDSIFEGFAIFSVFSLVTGALIWLVKTLVDYRRWSRLSKVQTEAHNKLLDRFTASEELLAYIGTPAGKRFLESAPIMLDASSSVASPLKRILWAVEIGVVLACGAGGILLGRSYAPPDFAQPLSVVGVFLIALGVGFIAAASASYVISRRLGVLPPSASLGTRDTDARPSA